jgi:putative CocE/NonD family hydrolase
MRRLAAASLFAAFLLTAFSGCLSEDSASGLKEKDARQLGAGTPASKIVTPGTYKFDARYSQVLADGPLTKTKPVLQMIKGKLGQDIEIGYWLPDLSAGASTLAPDGKVPIIVHASPYHRPAGTVVREAGLKQFLVDNFLPYGYAVAAVAVRGTGDSGGCMDLMGNKEISDLNDAITWLGSQPWSNGNVGMIGVSYDGSTPWSVAAAGNPHLKTIVPISGVPDVYGLMFRNGSAESRGPILLNYLYYTYGYAPSISTPAGTITDPVAGGDSNRTAAHRLEGLVCPESWTGFMASLYAGVHGERDPAGWWNERNRKPAVAQKYKGSVLSVQGLQDWNVDPMMVIPWADQLDQSGIPTYQLLGQWPHASPDRKSQQQQSLPTTRNDWAEYLLHWFDYWLKDIKTIDLGPKVQVQDDKFQWRAEDRFPPVDATWSRLHLSSGNKLTETSGAAQDILLAPAPLVAENPALRQVAESMRAVPGYSADFYLAAFEEPTQISGMPRLHVTVTPHGTSGHLAAWLYDVDGKNTMKRIGWTQMNLNFADGSEKSKPIVPNMPLVARMEFQPLDAYLPAGHRLMVRVWEFQEADRLPALPPGPVTLKVGGTASSTLEVPYVQRAADTYFQPPFEDSFKMPAIE